MNNNRRENISRLAFGAMRMPIVEGEKSKPDFAKAEAIIDRLYAAGVNYYDTAYMYHGGESESVLTRALAKYPRESYYLADKLPWTKLGPDCKPAELFEEQLRRCNTDYFDFYLLHNVSGRSVAGFEDEAVGVIPYVLKEREAGRIRHLGFSTHASPKLLNEFLDRHDCFEFVQMQLNYLDWDVEAQECYDIIVSHGLPVWVMEPVRGGRLAALTPEADALLKAARPDRSVASWAFSWLMGLPAVQVILSGMSTMEQAEDNIRNFAAETPLSADEAEMLKKAVSILKGRGDVPCTRCRYCSECPQGLDIPWLLGHFGALHIDRDDTKDTFKNVPADKQPSACIKCGLCAASCPQGIDIPEILAEFAAALAE